MSIGYNPPLSIGQVLKPRKTSTLPECKVKDFTIRGEGIEWLLNSAGYEGELRLSLSQIYKEFQFDV